MLQGVVIPALMRGVDAVGGALKAAVSRVSAKLGDLVGALGQLAGSLASSARSHSRAARPSCSSCCCATRAASSRASWRSSASGARARRGANVVDRYVAYLRRKLGDPPLIHTVRGVGFRLE